MDFITVHASCVAVQGNGALIIGASGSGKSSLALHLMAYGADLVADDRTRLLRVGADVVAKSPETIAHLIEARGIGILNAQSATQANVKCVVDLDQVEPDRLPPRRLTELLGCDIPLLYGVQSHGFAPALLQYLKAGRQDEA